MKSRQDRNTRRRVHLISLDWTREKDPRVPLGHASLLASLAAADEVDVVARSVPINGAGFDRDAVIDEILGLDAADLGIGVYVWNDHHVRHILAQIRERGYTGRIILGGPQISYAGPGLEALYPEADVFVRGYAEQALQMITGTEGHVEAPGIHYAGDLDRATQARVEPAELPSPYLSKLLVLTPGAFVRWETQRGCPYRCSFCQHREAGARLRRRALQEERLRQEISLFVRSGVRDIAVLDPIFNLGEHSVAVLQHLAWSGYRGRLSLQCRFETLTEEFLDASQRLDVCLEFGLQTIHEAEGRAIGRINRMPLVERALEWLGARRMDFLVTLFSAAQTVIHPAPGS